eukprot:Sspe_Gene.60579::Locus_33429_Transcript_1_1_Confidence_1.000_Length_2624::g.60579::m.60579
MPPPLRPLKAGTYEGRDTTMSNKQGDTVIKLEEDGQVNINFPNGGQININASYYQFQRNGERPLKVIHKECRGGKCFICHFKNSTKRTLLGRGSLGSVYSFQSNGEKYAVKVIHLKSPSMVSASSQEDHIQHLIVSGVVGEFNSRKIHNNKHIRQILGARVLEKGCIEFLMEYLPHSLDDLSSMIKILKPEEIQHVMAIVYHDTDSPFFDVDYESPVSSERRTHSLTSVVSDASFPQIDIETPLIGEERKQIEFAKRWCSFQCGCQRSTNMRVLALALCRKGLRTQDAARVAVTVWSLLYSGTARCAPYMSMLPERVIAGISQQIVCALSAMRKHHIVHKDLKPANLLFGNGVVKVSDFGTSKEAVQKDDVLTAKSPFGLGTAAYQAPEFYDALQDFQKQFTSAVDVWSVGLTVLQLATPHDYKKFLSEHLTTTFLARENATCISDYCTPDTMSPELYDFVARCLSFHPTARATPDELAQHPFIKTNSRSCACVDDKSRTMLATFVDRVQKLSMPYLLYREHHESPLTADSYTRWATDHFRELQSAKARRGKVLDENIHLYKALEKRMLVLHGERHGFHNPRCSSYEDILNARAWDEENEEEDGEDDEGPEYPYVPPHSRTGSYTKRRAKGMSKVPRSKSEGNLDMDVEDWSQMGHAIHGYAKQRIGFYRFASIDASHANDPEDSGYIPRLKHHSKRHTKTKG